MKKVNGKGAGGLAAPRMGKFVSLCCQAAFLLALAGAGALAQKAAVTASKAPWWKHAVIYQIYPRSFQDTTGDGIGDLNGITKRLDYLRGLGVDAIWLSPIYPSPQVDFGYDITNLEAIEPQYGTMADFDRLLAAAKKRHIRILMDLVPCCTSDKHPWFLESESSRNNPKSDWYIWRDGKGPGIPPNNWQTYFGDSAWTFDPKRDQWFYTKYFAQGPSLNWRNPQVRQAMFAACRFWLNKGVAGFRVDSVQTLFVDKQMRDARVLPGKNLRGGPRLDITYTDNLPEDRELMGALRKLVDGYPGDRVLIGETHVFDIRTLRKWYGENNDGLQLPMYLGMAVINKMDVAEFRTHIDQTEHDLNGGQPLFVFDNHDSVRSWDRYGDGVHNVAIARVLAAILLATRATPLMYYGQEIGMKTTTPTRIQDVKDIVGKIAWPKDKGRDGERTPMQWDGTPNAGFTLPSATPWLPIPPTSKTVNVALESREPDSLLNWYKRLIFLRRTSPSLRDGNLTMLNVSDNSVLSWLRQSPGNPAVLVSCNFTSQPVEAHFDLSAEGVTGTRLKTLAKSPGIPDAGSLRSIQLPAFGVYIGQVQ